MEDSVQSLIQLNILEITWGMLLDNNTNGRADMLQPISFQGVGVQNSNVLSFFEYIVEHMYSEFGLSQN